MKGKNLISPYLYIGHACNNNCLFCSEADSKFPKKTLGQIKKEILSVRKKYNFINFMGREPTLREDFFSILEFARSKKFKKIGITTNGRLLSYPGFAKKVLISGVNQIGITLNGATPKTHDFLTQVPGSFEQTLQGIKNIVRYKTKNQSLLINFPLNKVNALELNRYLAMIEKLKIKETNILHVAPLSRGSEKKGMIIQMRKGGNIAFNSAKIYIKENRMKILLVEFLPCSLEKKARKYFFPCLEKNPQKIRISLCKKCPYTSKCDGVLKSYIKMYGEKEFKL